MDALQKRNNDALNVNTPTVNGVTADITITVRGSDWYWAVCAVMTVGWMAVIGISMTKPRHSRIFHYISAGLLMVASVAYFSMGSNLGFVPIAVEYQRPDPRVSGQYRSIFYVRYIDWVITTPLLLMDLLLTAGLPWPTVLWVILVDEVMIITGLVGALVRSSYKWGYFTFGCAALAYVVYVLVWEARLNAKRLGNDVEKVYLYCGALTAVLWILYPVAWGVCEGGNVIAPDSEAIFYGILDLFAKPVFTALLLFGHRNIDPARLGLSIKDYADDPHVTLGAGGEKHHHGAPGATNGRHNNVDRATNGHHNGVTNVTNGTTTVANVAPGLTSNTTAGTAAHV